MKWHPSLSKRFGKAKDTQTSTDVVKWNGGGIAKPVFETTAFGETVRSFTSLGSTASELGSAITSFSTEFKIYPAWTSIGTVSTIYSSSTVLGTSSLVYSPPKPPSQSKVADILGW